MRTLFVFGIVVMLSRFGAALTPAHAMDSCEEVTIDSLHICVMHALDMGHIDNPGVGNSLLAKLDAAQRALDRGQSSVAIRILTAFTREVEAQAGKHIHEEHAHHMLEHARKVIQALGG